MSPRSEEEAAGKLRRFDLPVIERSKCQVTLRQIGLAESGNNGRSGSFG
jgi:hypothetical protein